MLEKPILPNNTVALDLKKREALSDARFTHERSHEKQKNHTLRWFLVVSIFVSIIFFGVVNFLKSPQLTVTDMSVAGFATIDPDVLKKTVYDYNHQIGIFGIPVGNRVTLSLKKLEKYILMQHAEIKTIHTYFSDAQVLIIEGQEYSPSYLWCQDDMNCFFADETGYLYKKSNQYSAGVYVVFTGFLQNPDAPILRNNIFKDTTTRDFVMGLMQVFDTHGFFITHIGNINSDIIQVSISRLGEYTKNHNITLRLSRSATTEYIDTVLRLLIADKTFQHSLDNNDRLEYIDIQYKDKIFYKFTGKENFTLPSQP